MLSHILRMNEWIGGPSVPEAEDSCDGMGNGTVRVKGWVSGVSVLLFLVWGPALEAQRGGAPRLGVDGLVLFREEGSVAVLARATPHWREVVTRSEELLGDFRYLPEYATVRTRGQVFEIVSSDGAGFLPVGERQFVAVPWSFGPGCAEEGWEGPEWVPPGDTVTFLLVPTRTRSSWREGLPVFDVLGWHQPYPVGDLIPFWRSGPRSNPNWLSASEFFKLVSLLLPRSAFEVDPEA